MNSQTLIRWSGPVLLLAGILIAAGTLTHPDDLADPGAVLTARWVLAHSLYLVGAVLSLFGLVGLYARQAEQVGWPGLIGFVLAFSSSALFIAAFTIETFVVPVLAADAAGGALLNPLFGGPLGIIFLLVARACSHATRACCC